MLLWGDTKYEVVMEKVRSKPSSGVVDFVAQLEGFFRFYLL